MQTFFLPFAADLLRRRLEQERKSKPLTRDFSPFTLLRLATASLLSTLDSSATTMYNESVGDIFLNYLKCYHFDLCEGYTPFNPQPLPPVARTKR